MSSQTWAVVMFILFHAIMCGANSNAALTALARGSIWCISGLDSVVFVPAYPCSSALWLFYRYSSTQNFGIRPTYARWILIAEVLHIVQKRIYADNVPFYVSFMTCPSVVSLDSIYFSRPFGFRSEPCHLSINDSRLSESRDSYKEQRQTVSILFEVTSLS